MEFFPAKAGKSYQPGLLSTSRSGEMADALRSGRSPSNGVEVQVLSSANIKYIRNCKSTGEFSRQTLTGLTGLTGSKPHNFGNCRLRSPLFGN